MEEKPKRHGIENLKPLKPGQTENQNGRPKGSRNLSTILREMLEEEVEVTTENGREKKKLQEVMIRKLIKAATKPGELKQTELRAIQEIFDRVEGKPKQEVDQVTTIEDKRVDVSKLTDDELRLLADIQRKSGIS